MIRIAIPSVQPGGLDAEVGATLATATFTP